MPPAYYYATYVATPLLLLLRYIAAFAATYAAIRCHSRYAYDTCFSLSDTMPLR